MIQHISLHGSPDPNIPAKLKKFSLMHVYTDSCRQQEPLGFFFIVLFSLLRGCMHSWCPLSTVFITNWWVRRNWHLAIHTHSLRKFTLSRPRPRQRLRDMLERNDGRTSDHNITKQQSHNKIHENFYLVKQTVVQQQIQMIIVTVNWRTLFVKNSDSEEVLK